MDTDLEEEISIGTESYMLLRHQDPSPSFEDWEEVEEKGSDSGTRQTRSKRNVYAGPPPECVSQILYATPHPELLVFYSLSDLVKSTCTVISITAQKVMTSQYLRRKNVLLSCFSSENEPRPA